MANDNENDIYDNQGNIDINNPEFNDNGESKKNKIKAISNAGQALQIAQKLEWQDRDRDIRRSRVLAAYNGASPYSDGALTQRAQAYRYNVSFGFMEGVIGRAIVPYNELTINFKDLTAIEANLPDDKLKVIQAELGKVVEKWGKWPKFISRLNQDLILNGYNTAIFPSDYDPFPVFVAQKDGFTDEGVMNDVNDLQVFIWRKSYMLHELYAKIEDADVAKKAGWNVKNVRQALMGAQADSVWNKSSTTSGTWTAVESLIRDGALYASIVGAKLVNVYHVFATEIDGKVTHYITINNGVVDLANDDYDEKIELFKKEDRFDSMRDFLVYFDVETGDGTWHGSKGVGQRVFNTHKAIDKLRCSLLDQAFVSGLTLLQPGDQVSQEDMTLAVFGPFAVIPAGIQIAATTLPAISGTTFQVDSLLSATSEQRIGDIVPQTSSFVTGASKTATEARISAGRQELIARGNLKRYIDPVSQLISIMVRRLLINDSPNAYAKEFQKELKRHGLSDDDLKEIRGARNTGRIDDVLGTTAQNTQIIFGEFRGDPEIDQEKLKRKRIASVLDADAANELMISDKDQTKTIEAQRMQELENTTLQTGVPVPVSARDNHEAHLDVVLEWIGMNVQSQAQQFNEQAIPILKLATAHAASHLGFLQQDKVKKPIFDKYKKRVNEAVGAINKLTQQGMQLAKASIDQAAKIARTPEEMAQVEQAQQQLESQSV